MKIYNYHPLTGEFIRETTAKLDPIEGKPLIPAYATEVAPPTNEAGNALIYIDGAWTQVEDKRGTVYWLADRTEYVHEVLGGLPANALLTQPPAFVPTYAELRATAYPPITDQLDTIYHEGIDAWKAVITAVKEEYPKP